MAKEILLANNSSIPQQDLANNVSVFQNADKLYVGYKGYFISPYSFPQVAIYGYDGALSFTSSVWNTFPIDDEISDADGIASVASNEITLIGEGLYWIKATVGVYSTTYRARIRVAVNESLNQESIVMEAKRVQNITVFQEILAFTSSSFDVQIQVFPNSAVSRSAGAEQKILVEVWKWGDLVVPSENSILDTTGIIFKAQTAGAGDTASNNVHIANVDGSITLAENEAVTDWISGRTAIFGSYGDDGTIFNATFSVVPLNRTILAQPFAELDTSTHQITLTSGTYEIYSEQYAYDSNPGTLRLYEVTSTGQFNVVEDSITSDTDASSGEGDRIVYNEIFVITDTVVIELQAATGANQSPSASTDGYGNLTYIRRI